MKLFSDNSNPPLSIWGYTAWHPSVVVIGFYWFVGFFVSVTSPNEVFSAVEWGRRFAEAVAAIVPSIEAFSAVSNFPDLAMFFFSVMWFLLIPVVAVAYFLSPPRPVRPLSWHGKLGASLGAVMFMFIAYLLFSETRISPSDLTYSLGRGKALLTIMLTSRLGLAIVGPLMMAALSLALVMAIFVVRHVWIAAVIRILPFGREKQ